MTLLLDTHTLLFFLNGDKDLPEKCRSLIQDSSNDIVISVVSVWEIAIKNSLGKLELKNGIKDVINQLSLNAISVWQIGNDDLITLNALPFHHRDPFDRMIIAQLITYNKKGSISIITRDRNFSLYGVVTIW
ncbi:MAG TPA: type II toxin-antitoxin system VapC family toxin [Chitinophagales bacterium]|nr:type II toxin-antitoxin system VapC family toxin [Chitinophagales bacterium]